MKALHSALLASALVLTPTLAWSWSPNPVHSVWSDGSPLYIADPVNGWQNAVDDDAAISWQENTTLAFANARAQDPSGNIYEFSLVGTSASTTDDQIDGYWNVDINGTTVCSGCSGSAYGLSTSIGNYFKIYVDNYNYHFSGYVTNRYDY